MYRKLFLGKRASPLSRVTREGWTCGSLSLLSWLQVSVSPLWELPSVLPNIPTDGDTSAGLDWQQLQVIQSQILSLEGVINIIWG